MGEPKGEADGTNMIEGGEGAENALFLRQEEEWFFREAGL
ncbi:hypothetical protein GCM10020370_38030 [Paenibacillus hodogayensis]